MIKLSACLILKNEGETIYRCLDSIKDFVDEYIIGIDDKTDDNTEEQIQKFFNDNDKPKIIYKYTWQNDFSKARNEGMDKATGDYLLIMDGHEFFPNAWYNITQENTLDVQRQVLPHIKPLIEKEKPDEIYFYLYQQPFIGEIPNNFFLQPRIYRNDPQIRFGRAAHNTIQNTDRDKSMHCPEVLLIHDAPENNREDRKKQRVEMNTEELQKMIKEKENDTRAMFYLGNTLIEAGNFKGAIKAFNNYLKHRQDENSEKYQVLIHQAICYNKLKQIDKAIECLYKAMHINPARRDARILMGDIYIDNKDYDKAEINYKLALVLKPQPSRMFQNGAALTFDPHQKLAHIYKLKNDMVKAIAHLRRAYQYFPSPQWAAEIERMSAGKPNILIVDKIGSFTKKLYGHLERTGIYNIARTQQYNSQLGSWADYIFCEWVDENAIRCSREYPEKTVIRCHGYEYYLLKNVFRSIDFSKIKKIIFVAVHIMNKAVKEFNIPKEKVEMIYNDVDVESFYIKNEDRDPLNIGYVGFINEKKNPYLLCRIIKKNPKFKFHLRVDHQSPFWESAMKYELKDCKNVVYHGRYDDLNDFWNQMSGVLSTSIIESFSYNIAEAMACGCRPYIYDWEGSRNIWNKEWIFKDLPVLSTKKLTREKMDEYRLYIIDLFTNKLPELEKELIA